MRWALAFSLWIAYYILSAAEANDGLITLFAIVLVVSFVLYISAIVRRLHDFNKNGWLALLIIVPLVNIILWAACMFGRGDGLAGNDYGYRAGGGPGD